MKQLIVIICIAMSPLFGIAQQSDSLVYCEYPDTYAEPPYRVNELLHIILDNQGDEMPDGFDPNGRFYYNIIILDDGSLALLNLECISDNTSCYLTVEDLSKLEKWIPATKNGANCNQKVRKRISCILFN